MNQKIKTYIGFALKKGSVVFGLDNIRKKPSAICLVLVCETASEKTVKETEFFCRKNKIPLVLFFIPLFWRRPFKQKMPDELQKPVRRFPFLP